MVITLHCKRTEDTVKRSTSTCRSAKDTGFIQRDATKRERERYEERSREVNKLVLEWGVSITLVHYNSISSVRRVEALTQSI